MIANLYFSDGSIETVSGVDSIGHDGAECNHARREDSLMGRKRKTKLLYRPQ